jgi:hypothetical protein
MKLTGHIERIKEEIFQTYIQSLTTADTDYSLWKATKRLKPTQHIPPIEKSAPHLGPKW